MAKVDIKDFTMSSIKILVPRLYHMGGVANIYNTLREHLSPEYEYIYRGNASRNESILTIPWRMFKDYFVFCKKTWFETKAIVLNSSLGYGGFVRDGIYFKLAPRRVKKIVFFHGWNHEFENKIDKSCILKSWIKMTFFKANHIIVLSSEFKNKLRELGYKESVSLESTLVDESILERVNFESLVEFRTRSENTSILYLGNISKAKGVWEVIEAYRILCNKLKSKNLKCNMAGDGQELDALKKYVNTHNLFLAWVFCAH